MIPIIQIDQDNPFRNCKLHRESYAKVLTSIVETNNQGFVLAIDNEWGTGKTTFVKMWQQHLSNENFKTIYFNAWENDFEENPLTALIGELNNFVKTDTVSEYKDVIKKGVIISKHILPIIVKSLVEKYIDTKSITDGLEKLTEGVTSIFENEIDEYSERKKNINDFRTSLAKFIADTSDGKPVVFIIDELDRCRPNYAVGLLEQIKHFFIVPNIVFALTIDKEQLQFAIKGVYNSESINTEEYLRRFIDIEYTIPEPEPEIFINYLFDYFHFEQYFTKEQNKRDFKKVLQFLVQIKKLTLRQQEKLFAHANVVFKTSGQYTDNLALLMVVLLYFRMMHKNLYDQIRHKKLSIPDLQNKIFEIFTLGTNDHILIRLEAHLMFYYRNYSEPRLSLHTTNEGVTAISFPSIFGKQHDQSLLNILESLQQNWDYNDFQIIQLMNKLDLVK